MYWVLQPSAQLQVMIICQKPHLTHTVCLHPLYKLGTLLQCLPMTTWSSDHLKPEISNTWVSCRSSNRCCLTKWEAALKRGRVLQSLMFLCILLVILILVSFNYLSSICFILHKDITGLDRSLRLQLVFNFSPPPPPPPPPPPRPSTQPQIFKISYPIQTKKKKK